MQPLDRSPGDQALSGQRLQRRGDKDTDPLVRRENDTGPGLGRLVIHRGRRTSVVRHYAADVNRWATATHLVIRRAYRSNPVCSVRVVGAPPLRCAAVVRHHGC
jgi:hypothetical protein